MNVSGHAVLDAPRAAVFAAICDPGTLLEIIPGCREIRQVSPDEYHGTIVMRLPAIVGSYDTVVRLVETDPPVYGAFDGRVDGRAGGITGHASFRLAESDDGTTIDYEGTGLVNGPLARLDSRFIESLAKGLIDEGLARLGRRLRSMPVEPAQGESDPG
jgi:carbon monoxide dehydrogenase subunit G